MKKYRLVGRCICTGPNDWPPLLRDNSASHGTMLLVVNALNYYYESMTKERKSAVIQKMPEKVQ